MNMPKEAWTPSVLVLILITQLDQSNDQSTKTTNTHNSTSSQSTRGAPTNSSQSPRQLPIIMAKHHSTRRFEKLGSDLRDI